MVETEKWRVPSNRLPPRPQSALNQAELVMTLDTLKKGGIIEPSQASHYSQVLLIPKPDGSSRMCINYIALNACTPDVSFPIPNIWQLFVRMGTKKPTIFGVMDLTQVASSYLTKKPLSVSGTSFFSKIMSLRSSVRAIKNRVAPSFFPMLPQFSKSFVCIQENDEQNKHLLPRCVEGVACCA